MKVNYHKTSRQASNSARGLSAREGISDCRARCLDGELKNVGGKLPKNVQEASFTNSNH
jgi:hypothetical protein